MAYFGWFLLSRLRLSRRIAPLLRKNSAIGPAEHFHQLGHLLTLLARVAARDRVLDAMGNVIAEHLLLDLAQGSAHRPDLCHDIDAIAVLIDHAADATHLPLDPVQALAYG
jgi:hypothetical protein